MRIGWLAAGALAAIAIVAWRSGAAARTAPPAAGAVVAAEAAAGGPADAAAAIAAERHAVEAGDSGIDGVVRDAHGVPLRGWSVRLGARGSAPPLLGPGAPRTGRDGWRFGSDFERRVREDWRARTDADGRFAFERLEPGAYTVSLVDGDAVEQDVELGVRERQHVGLRLRASQCAVVVALTRRGEPLDDGRVFVRLTDGPAAWIPVVDGQARFVAGPGSHRLQVPPAQSLGERRSDVSLAGPRSSGPYTGAIVAELPFGVPPARAELRLAFDVAAPSLELVATDGGPAPFPHLVFGVEGRFAFGGAPGTAAAEVGWEFAATDGCSVQVAEMPPGLWTVTARSPYLLAEPQRIHVPAGAGAHRVVITGRRAAIVQLDLRTADGRPWQLPLPAGSCAGHLPPLRAGTGEIACGDVAVSLWPRRDGVVLGFVGVPPGRAEWPLADRVVDGQQQYLPFEPVPVPPLEVLAAGQDRLTVVVAPRALVELIGCRENGMEWPLAKVQVYRGDRLVRPLGEPDRSRWQAFLPPGEYRVAVARDGGEREHVLFVQRQNVTLRLRP